MTHFIGVAKLFLICKSLSISTHSVPQPHRPLPPLACGRQYAPRYHFLQLPLRLLVLSLHWMLATRTLHVPVRQSSGTLDHCQVARVGNRGSSGSFNPRDLSAHPQCAPQQRSYLRPEPHGHGSFRPALRLSTTAAGICDGTGPAPADTPAPKPQDFVQAFRSSTQHGIRNGASRVIFSAAASDSFESGIVRENRVELERNLS